MVTWRRMWDTGPHQRNGECLTSFAEKGEPHRTGTHTGRYAHTSVGSHVAYARVCTCARRPFADCEILLVSCFVRFSSISVDLMNAEMNQDQAFEIERLLGTRRHEAKRNFLSHDSTQVPLAATAKCLGRRTSLHHQGTCDPKRCESQ